MHSGGPPFSPCLGRHCCVRLEYRFSSTAKCSSGSEVNLFGSLRLVQHSEEGAAMSFSALTAVTQLVVAHLRSTATVITSTFADTPS